eukprot:TRINITY_DN251_c0_g1_i2.p1 TRINITY_DN251_c0_g1~~TRINITY_DN251_c0_g1_i2.p1  ORF type:complete len:329 (+),score=121.12 TRINITY_DN251_c0_g1_i2:284-1270(+)
MSDTEAKAAATTPEASDEEAPSMNKLTLFYEKWDADKAKAWMKKIFQVWDTNDDGFLERSEINRWRELTTHKSDFHPFESDEDWVEYLKVNFGVELEEPKITLDQLFEIQKEVDQRALFLGGNSLFSDLWHMLDQGLIKDDQLVPHVVLKSECCICRKLKTMVNFRGITHDVRGDGQWSKPDTERVCIDCEEDSKYKVVSRHFELADIPFKFKFSFLTEGKNSHEVTKLYVDGELVGGIDYKGDGTNFAAKTYFKDKKVKTTSFFSLIDDEAQEKVDPEAGAFANKYFTELADRAKLSVNDLTLVLGDMFLFSNPDQVADIFFLESDD